MYRLKVTSTEKQLSGTLITCAIIMSHTLLPCVVDLMAALSNCVTRAIAQL